MKSDWEKFKEKRTNNIGFISRSNAFREPTETEKAVALAKETESWQSTIGQKTYSVSLGYSIPKGYGQNLLEDRRHNLVFNKKEAIKAYIETPIDAQFENNEIIKRSDYLIMVQTILFVTVMAVLMFLIKKGTP